MHLSCLLIDTGENPDRPRPGRLWLRNVYRVHQRLCMAFPSAARSADDPDFLAPYRPDDFGAGHENPPRAADSGFLFRIDPLPGGRAAILVQSAIEPNWDYAFRNASHLLAAPPDAKPFDPRPPAGARLRFRLVANPTKKIGTLSKEERQELSADELKGRAGRHGRRVPVPPGELLGWLVRRSAAMGFSIDEGASSVQPGYVYMNKPPERKGQRLRSARYEGALTVTDADRDKSPDGKGQRLRSARYEGVLTVIDADRFREALVRGVGPGKAFGFGLLSTAPLIPHSKHVQEGP